MPLINCLVCGKEKEVLKSRIKKGWAKFCSKRCFYIDRKGKKMPHNVEWERNRIIAVRANSWKLKGRKNPKSKQTIKIALATYQQKRKENPSKYRIIAIKNLSKNKSLSLSKEDSPNWKGGITNEWQKWRSEQGKKFDSWRKKIYSRDKKCRLCGSKKKLEAHHIIPVAECRLTAFLQMNGILLCRKCHIKTESFGGKISRKIQQRIEEGVGTMMCFVRTIPHVFQVYNTCGNYEWTEDGMLVVFISDMNNEQYTFLVAIHEIIEAYLCKKRGITIDSINKFDEQFEKDRITYQWGNDVEPGHDKKAPYLKEHVFAENVEKQLAKQSRIDWERYAKTVNDL